LIYVREGKHIWGQQYIRALEDILILQNELAFAIATHIKEELTLAEKKNFLKRQKINPLAYENYLEGLHYPSTKGGLTKSLEYFLLAVEYDSNFAPAYAMRANNYYMQ
jgi:hypothetical protein